MLKTCVLTACACRPLASLHAPIASLRTPEKASCALDAQVLFKHMPIEIADLSGRVDDLRMAAVHVAQRNLLL